MLKAITRATQQGEHLLRALGEENPPGPLPHGQPVSPPHGHRLGMQLRARRAIRLSPNGRSQTSACRIHDGNPAQEDSFLPTRELQPPSRSSQQGGRKRS